MGARASSQPGTGTQSESRKATRSVATAGVRCCARLRARARWRAAGRWRRASSAWATTAPGSSDPSSTTTIGSERVAGSDRRAVSSLPSPAGRSRTGITTVTPGAGTGARSGAAIPASSSRAASSAEVGSRTTSRSTARSARARADSRSWRSGEPPRSVAPSSLRWVRGSSRTANPSGSRPGGEAGRTRFIAPPAPDRGSRHEFPLLVPLLGVHRRPAQGERAEEADRERHQYARGWRTPTRRSVPPRPNGPRR